MQDLNYSQAIRPTRSFQYRLFDDEHIDWEIGEKLSKIWMDHMKEKYERTKDTDTPLGKFLKKYPLPLKEFFCLMELINNLDDMTDFEIDNFMGERKDIFKKHNVRYKFSMLKRHKLIYRITNPLRPLKTTYEVSYKVQLALKNKKYTDEYEQLDLMLEEESKKNSPEEMEGLYYIIDPKVSFDDLISSEKLKNDLKSAISREQKKDKIFKSWEFNKVIQYGRGTTLNFRGPPGTGKTMAAHCFANKLKKKLLIVRYDQLQSCWIGETSVER